jgi:D-sedoheptulose 7-phosphate isomerase
VIDLISKELQQANELLLLTLADEELKKNILKAANLLHDTFRDGNKVISCGNGGSYCDALHFTEELTGRFREDRLPMPALIAGEAAHLTCVSNDYGYEQVFSRYVEGLGRAGDILIGITTSGNSVSVINAARKAKEKGMKTIGLTGNNGGKFSDYCDIELRVPFDGYADRIQEVHIKILHIIIHLLEVQMKPTRP